MYAILAIIYLISPMIQENYAKAIDESFVTKILYDNNIILNIIA